MKPCYIAPDDSSALENASGLLAVYRHACQNNLTCNELDELSKNFIDTSIDSRFTSGLNKLLLDRCQFEAVEDIDYPARRLELLKKFPDLPLILGIDRSLADEGSLARMTADSPQLAQRCRLFRDFPGVSTTVNVLKKASERSKK